MIIVEHIMLSQKEYFVMFVATGSTDYKVCLNLSKSATKRLKKDENSLCMQCRLCPQEKFDNNRTS